MSHTPRSRKRPEPAPPRRTGRRSPPPPAILFGPYEALEGSGVLEELRTPAGALLWQSLHDVLLWASTPPSGREGLFQPRSVAARLGALVAVGVPDPLEAPLTVLAALVGNPGAAQAESVAAACLQVARWAEEEGSLQTAVAFAQGASLAAPADAQAALATGRLARRLGEEARAESWLRRTVGLGRRSNDRLALCRACLELGGMYQARGHADAARELYLRALRGGRRRRFRAVVGDALHALFTLEAGQARLEEADGYARAALRALDPADPRLAGMVRDAAARWLEDGRCEEAAAALREVLPHVRSPEERVVLTALLARAAGSAGDDGGFDEAARAVWEVVEGAGTNPALVPLLLDLARGAAGVRQWESAEGAAQRALELSLGAGDEEAAARAEAVLAAVWAESGGMRSKVAR